MATLIGIIAVLGTVVAFLFRSLQGAKTDAQLAQTKAKDSVLTEHENDVKAAIASLDEGIAKAKAQKESDDRKAAEDNMSLKERADRLKKGLS